MDLIPKHLSKVTQRMTARLIMIVVCDYVLIAIIIMSRGFALRQQLICKRVEVRPFTYPQHIEKYPDSIKKLDVRLLPDTRPILAWLEGWSRTPICG
jgi:hypothetical protein